LQRDAAPDAELFAVLVKARDRLLAAIGDSAPPPKPPQYAPRGAHIVTPYGLARSAVSEQRSGSAAKCYRQFAPCAA